VKFKICLNVFKIRSKADPVAGLFESLKSWPIKAPLIASVALGAGFGIVFRLLLEAKSAQRVPYLDPNLSLAMTLAFITLVPFGIGYLTIHAADRATPRNALTWIFAPWLSVLVCMALTFALNEEGLLCIVFALPISLLFATAGGVVAGLVARHRNSKGNMPVACVVILPFLLVPLEGGMHAPVEIREIRTEIRIHAPVPEIWHHIGRVQPITAKELPETWTHAIGIPRPIEATLTHEGMGGIRFGRFEHGLSFVETVTRWDEDRVLAFSIKADSAGVPRGVLDEHAEIGGRYFDVLDAEYRLEPLAGGDVLLHLTTHERLSTDFNGYTGLWTDAVMRSFQMGVLEVIKHRCET